MAQKKQFGTRLADHPSDIVTDRARELGESQGGYIELIVQWWIAQGAPPVSEYEAKLMAEKAKKAQAIDVWNLNPHAVYQLVNDGVISDILRQLGVPNLFASMAEHDEVQAVVAFDNHPTHWLVIRMFKGSKAKDGNGLLFSAKPKSSTSRAQMLADLEQDAREMEAEQPVRFSQIPAKN